MVPEISKLCRIALCIAVTSVECERSFSTHNKIKSKFRSSLKTENLNYLMNIHVSSEELETYNPEKAVKIWKIKKKRRQGILFQPYKAYLLNSIYPFYAGGHFHCYMLDESICHFWVSGLFCHFSSIFDRKSC